MFVNKNLIRSGFKLKHYLLWPDSSFSLEQQIKQHLECYCQQIFQSTTSGFTTMNSNVKEQKGTMANTTDAHHQMLYLQMQVTLQMLHLRTQVTL